jgi:hypothetical protein
VTTAGCSALFRAVGTGINSTVGRYSSAIRRSPDSARRYMFDTLDRQDPTLERDLRCLSDWQRRYLPNIHSPLGQQILAWLIRNRDQPKPFSHLLVSTRFSPTSVRHLLNQFAVLGLVEVRNAPVTCRRGDIVATPKLKERLEEYSERRRGIISHYRGMGLNSSQSAGSPRLSRQMAEAPIEEEETGAEHRSANQHF